MATPSMEFTPRPNIGDRTSTPWVTIGFRLFVVILPKRKAWHYTYCEHHTEEFIKLSRASGDKYTYYSFITDDIFCNICYALAKDREPMTFPQVNTEVYNGNVTS